MIISVEDDLAIQKVFTSIPGFQQVWLAIAQRNCEAFDGDKTTMAVQVDKSGKLGMMYPKGDDLYYAVRAQNHFRCPAMPAKEFGAAVTALTALQLSHDLANTGQMATSRIASNLYHKLKTWVFVQKDLDHKLLYEFMD